jgi:hypothetical protein
LEEEREEQSKISYSPKWTEDPLSSWMYVKTLTQISLWQSLEPLCSVYI